MADALRVTPGYFDVTPYLCLPNKPPVDRNAVAANTKIASTTTSETIRGTGFVTLVCTSIAVTCYADAPDMCDIGVEWQLAHQQ